MPGTPCLVASASDALASAFPELCHVPPPSTCLPMFFQFRPVKSKTATNRSFARDSPKQLDNKGALHQLCWVACLNSDRAQTNSLLAMTAKSLSTTPRVQPGTLRLHSEGSNKPRLPQGLYAEDPCRGPCGGPRFALGGGNIAKGGLWVGIACPPRRPQAPKTEGPPEIRLDAEGKCVRSAQC